MPDTSSTIETSSPGPWAGRLLKCVDGLIAILICVLPFVMGGREAWGHWLLITTSGTLAAMWCLYSAVSGNRYRISWLEVFFLGGFALVWFQLQPQTPETLNSFSPEYERLLPLWSLTQTIHSTTENDPARSWNTLSLTPVETSHGLRIFLAYCLIALVFFQRLKTRQDCHLALKAVAASGAAMAMFGLLQWASSNGKFFWVYEHPFTDPTEHLKGAFTNRNHFAQFLAISIGPLLWWLLTVIRQVVDGPSTSGTKSYGSSKSGQNLSAANSNRLLTIPIAILVICVGAVGLSVLLSLSRGGMIGAAAAVIIAAIGLWRSVNLPGTMAALLLGTSVMVFTGLAFIDQDQVQTRIEELISGDTERVDTNGVRRAIWAADAKVIEQFPLLGTGIGSHRDVYPLYMDNYADFATFEMTHAESSYVHLALEAGLIGIGLLILSLLYFLLRMVIGYFQDASYEHRSILVAVAASSAAAILHAVTDFIWYVPGIVVVSLMLVAIGLNSAGKQRPLDSKSGLSLPRAAWCFLAVLCFLPAVLNQAELSARIEAERHWYASLNMKFLPPLDDDGFADLQAGDTIVLEDEKTSLEDNEPKELTEEQLEQHRLAEVAFLKNRIQRLRHCIQARPDQHRPQIAMAENLLRLFDLLQADSSTPMPLNQVRDAATSNEFHTVDDLQQWLENACENRIQLVYLADHLARQSLARCPVQGYGYLNLLETTFIHKPTGNRHQQLLDQAMLVRGHDPRIQFVAGREALMNSDLETAFEYWDSVFHSSQHFRLNILKMLAPQMPAAFFVNQFHPNAEELMDVLVIYEALEREPDSDFVRRQLCEVIPKEAPTIEDEDERLRQMLFASQFAMELEDHRLAITILHQTLQDFPTCYDAHHRLAVTLFELEDYQQALVHLKWCYEWDPASEWVPELIRASRARIVELAEEREQQANPIQRAAWIQPIR